MVFKLKPSHFVVVACIFVVFYLMTFVQTPLVSYTSKLYYAPSPNSDPTINQTQKQFSSNSLVSLLFPVAPASIDNNNEIELINEIEPDQPVSLFSKVLGQFDWEGYSASVQMKQRNITEVEIRMKDLMNLLNPFLVFEPKVPINSSCIPPLLEVPEEINCSNREIGTAFTGKIIKKHRKIGILIQFGFGVDVLEIYLNEMWDVVDQFFITESTKAHFRTLSKPLLWEQVKNQPRFSKFSSKITHFIIDDAENAPISKKYRDSTKLIEEDKIWGMEKTQESLRWTKFLGWNKEFKMFEDDDLIGFGDADEIPSRKMVNMMKYCELKKDVFDFGIWFPFGNIKYAFATDFPVPGFKYTLGDPSFWTLKSAMSLTNDKHQVPGRMRGYSGSFLLGGIHMTHYGYLPYQFIRDLSCTECGPWAPDKIIKIGNKISSNEIRALEIEHGAIPKGNLLRTVNLTSIAEQMVNIAILPWFYDCNRNRYPVWEGNHDTRLD